MGTLFGTDGIRGLVGSAPITPDFVMKLGWAAGKVFATEPNAKVIIGKDTRVSGYMLEAALEAGFAAAGVDTEFLGPMPTPAVAYLTRAFRASAGIVISASHNPFHDNGIKFFSSQGYKLSTATEQHIQRMLDEPMDCVASSSLGRASRIQDAGGRYIEFCKNTFPHRLSLKGLKLVVDCAHGATYDVAPRVFRELGADVVAVAIEPNGFNINEQCGATHTTLLEQSVVEHQADLGLALDGDGDRIILVDQHGKVIDGDAILYALSRQLLSVGALEGGVVGTLMSNKGLEVAMEDLGIPFLRSQVGDRYVMEMLEEQRWLLGGESSGHIINLSHHSTGDGIIAALQFLAAMVESGRSATDLIQGYIQYPQKTANVRVPEILKKKLLRHQLMEQAKQDIESSLGRKGRVLIRASGTEPLIRLTVEADSLSDVERYVGQLQQALESVLKQTEVA